MSALKFQASAILIVSEKTAMEMRNTFHSHTGKQEVDTRFAQK